MAVTIFSNISALQAQRRLSENTRALNQTFEKLSSGLRINRAGDDAAGLAISESLKADTRVFHQAVRNLNDGMSLLAVADGAIEEMSSIVIRLKELAEQSANGIYGNSQRKALDLEAQALSREFERINQSVVFNGRAVFSPAFGSLYLQGGYGADGAIQSHLGGASGTGAFTSSTVGTSGTAVITGDFNLDGNLDMVKSLPLASELQVLLGCGDGTFANPVQYSGGSSTQGVASGDFNGDGKLDLVASGPTGTGVDVLIGRGDGTFLPKTNYSGLAGSYKVATGDFNGDGYSDVALTSLTGNLSIYLANANGTLQSPTNYTTGTTPQGLATGDFNGDNVLDIVTANNGSANLSVFLGRGNGTFNTATNMSAAAGTGSVTTADFNNDGYADIATGSEVFIANGTGGFSPALGIAGSPIGGIVAGDFNGDGAEDLITSSYLLYGNGKGNFSGAKAFSANASMQAGDFNGDGVLDVAGTDNVFIAGTSSGVSSILNFSLATRSDALQAIAPLTRKLSQLSTQRGTIGAFQSRITAALNNIQSSTENFSAAVSRITDADIAEETARLTRGRILQQASSLVLAQANLQPQLALRLLES